MADNIRVKLQPAPRVIINQVPLPNFLRDLVDVDVTDRVDGSLLIYDATDEKFKASTTLEKQTIKIKRTGIEGEPITLASGELFYSYLQGNESNGGDRLYIGTGTETTPNQAPNIEVIGGKYFTDKLDHTVGILTANSAILVDANKSINELIVDQLTFDGSSISSSTGMISFNGSKLIDLAEPTENSDATTKLYVDTILGNENLSLQGDIGSDEIFLKTDILSVLGDTGITVTVQNKTISIDLDDTDVNAGIYGSGTKIPSFTVDQQGRLTAASEISIATDLSIAGDTGADVISLLTDVLTFAGDTGITTTVTNNTVNIDLDDTSVNIGSYGTENSVGSFVVDKQGRLTSATDIPIQIVSTQITQFVEDVEDIVGGLLIGNINQGITATYDDNTSELLISANDATTSSKGVSSFETDNFIVVEGNVSAKEITIGTTTLNLGSSVSVLEGITQIDIGNIRINNNTISSTDTNGNITLSPNNQGYVSVNGSIIKNVSNPIDPQDAATKSYVDAVAEGLNVKHAAEAASRYDLGGTYDNGIQGIGSTITIPPIEILDVDGWSDWSLFDGILVKSQTNGEENGRYYVSQIGDISTDWILTRCGSCDTPSEIIGAYVFVVHGDIYGSTGWVATVDDAGNFSVGIDPIYWLQFSGVGTFTAGEGLSLYGTQFNVNVDDSTIEIFDDILRVKDSGITNEKLLNPSIRFAADVGNTDIVSLGEIITFASGEGITTEVSDNTITISGDDATYVNKGIASFSPPDFIVSSGAVSIRPESIQDIVAGFVVEGNAISINYNDNINTIEIAANIATNSNLGVAKFSTENFEVIAGDVTITYIDGGSY
jgi:hypothetical protein